MAFREIITRGNLPHWFIPGAAHFVTYRLAETLPLEVMKRLQANRDRQLNRAQPNREVAHKQFFADYDRHLDRVCSKDWLIRSGVPDLIIENLLHHHGTKYQLLEFAIMPNHVHVLLFPINSTQAGSPNNNQPIDSVDEAASFVGKFRKPGEFFSGEVEDSNSPLSSIMHSLKSYTANQINKHLGRKGQLWQHESYDHWVRDEDELMRIAEYIALNPFRAGLARDASDWAYGSVGFRLLNPELLPDWK